MPSINSPLILAAVQHAPVFLDAAATLERTTTLISEAASRGARVVVFPEAFIPAYPDWVWLVPNAKKAELDDLYRELVTHSVTIGDETTASLCRAAKGANIHLAIGVTERNAEASGASLFNTLLFINNEGEILGAHRKLIPTGGERLVWGQGDGSTLHAFDTPVGKLGGLLCWENHMPLARQAMYSWGTQIHVAPTWDSSESWLRAMRHIAWEGSMFVVSCCQAVRMDDLPDRLEFKRLYPEGREWINKGNSCIIDPAGNYLAGPVEAKQDILYAEIDLGLIPAAKRMFDVAGHYARPDVFHFEINRKPNLMMRDHQVSAACSPEDLPDQ